MDHQEKRMRKHENGAVTSSIATSSLSSSSVAAASSSSASSSTSSSASSLDLGLSLGLAMLAPQLGSPSSAAMLASPGPPWSPSGCTGLPLGLPPPPPPPPSSSGCSSAACSSASSSSTYSSAGSCCASTSSSSSPLQKTMYPPGPSFSGYPRPQGAHHHHLGLLAQESAHHQMLHQQQHQRDQQMAQHDHVRVKRERGDCSGCAAAAWRESCEAAVLYGMQRGAAASLLSRAHTVTTSASHGSICWAGVGSGPAAGAIPTPGPGPGPNGNTLKAKSSNANSSQRYSSSWHDRPRTSPQTPLSAKGPHEDRKQTRTLGAHQDVLSRLPPLPPPPSHMCDMMMTTPSVDATDLSTRCFKAPLAGYTGLDCTKQPKEGQSAARQKITTSKDRVVNVMDNRSAASLMTSHANGSSPYDMVPPEPLEGHGFPCGLPHLTDSMGHPMPPHYLFDWPAHAHPSHFPAAAHMSLTAAHPGYLLPSQHHPPHPSPPHLMSEHPSGMGLGSLMTSRPSLSPMNCSAASNGRHGQGHPDEDGVQMNGRRQEGEKSKGKHSEGSGKGSSSIPVGIAVARQRRENKRRNAANGEDCRTSSEECASRNADLMCQDAKELSRRKVLYRHPLEVVAAGGSSAPCVPWEDIPKSVAPSMQSHWMPPSHHSLGQTLWLNQGPYPPVSVQISPMEPGHPPFPPFGYQLSRDPITGHLLLIPAANLDLIDRPGMWPSLAPSSMASPASHHPLHPYMLHQPTFLHQPTEIPKPCDYSLGLVRQAKMEEQSEGLCLEDEKSPTVNCNVDRKADESLVTVPPVPQPPISEPAALATTLETATSRSEQKKERVDPVLVSSGCLTYPPEFPPPSPSPMPFFHSSSSSDRSADGHKRSQGTSPVNPGTCLTPISEPGDATLEDEATSNDTATALTASVTTNTPPDYYAFDASACTDNPGTPCSDGGSGTKSEPLMADASNQTETPPLTEEEESLGDMGEYDEEEEEEMLDVGHCRECDQGLCVEVEREYIASQQMNTEGEPADEKADPSEPSNASEDIDVEVVEDVPVVEGDDDVEVDVCTTNHGLELLSNSILEHEQAHRTSCIRIPQDDKLEDASNCASDKLDAPNGCPADSRESAGGLSILCALAEQRIKEETLVVGPVKCNSNSCVSVESDAPVIPIDEQHAEGGGGGGVTATAKSLSRTPHKEFKLFIAHKISQYTPLGEEKCQQVQPQAAAGSTVVATRHDKEAMDTAEFQMRLRLAELQKQYREKQKELAKLQPRKEKVPVVPGATVLVGIDTGDLSPVKRGPGRPRKRKLPPPMGSGVPVKIITTAITTSVTTAQITVPMLTSAKKEAEDARKMVVAKPNAVLTAFSSSVPTTTTTTTSHFKMGRPILKPPTLITHKLAYTPHMLLTNVTNAKARYHHTLQPWERMATVHPPAKTSAPVAARGAKPSAAMTMTSVPKANASNKLGRKHLAGHHQHHRHRHRNRGTTSKQQRSRVMIHDSSSSDDFDDTETSSSDEEVVRPTHRISVGECKEAKQVIGRFVPGNSTRFVLPYCCDEVQGLGLLARYAAENVEQTRSNTGSLKRKMVADCGSEDTRMLNRDGNGALVSSSKKRKPGRPKKHSSSPNEDATETIVAKTPKMMPNYTSSTARMGKPKSEMTMKMETTSKRSLQNQQQHSFLEDEAWLRRRSERIFLSESVAHTTATNSNTSPTAISNPNQSNSNSGNNHVSNIGISSCISSVTGNDTKKIVAPSSFKLASEEQPIALPPSKFKSEEPTNKVCVATSQLPVVSKKSDTVNRVKKRSLINTKSLKMDTVPTSSTLTKPKKSSSKERERDVPEELFEALKQKCRLNDSNQKGGLSPRDSDYEDVDSNSTVSSSHSVASSVSGCVNPLSGNSSSYSEGENLPLIQLVERTTTPEPRSCVIGAKELGDKLRVLALMDGLFYAGHINAIRAPDVYGVTIDGERGNRPHIYSREEILKEAILEVKPGSVRYLPEGTRVCAYWSQQYRCLYPGTVAKSTSPNPTADKKYVNVEFDDGDSGKIPVGDVRLLPHDFPNISYDPNPLMLLGKRRTKTSNDVPKGDGSKSSSSLKHSMQRSGNSSCKQFHVSINKKKKCKKNTGSAPKVMTNCSPNENTNGKDLDCTKRASSSSGSKYMPVTSSLSGNSNPERQPVASVKHHKSDGNCKKPKKGNYLTDVVGRCKDPEEMKTSAEGKSSKKRKKHKDRVVERKRHRHHHHHRSSSGSGSHYNRHQSHRYLHHKHRHKRAKKEQDPLPVPSAPARGVVAPGVMAASVKRGNLNVTQGFTIAEARKSELTVKIRTGGSEKEIRGSEGAAKHSAWHDSETSSSSNSPSEDSDTTTSSSSSSSSSSAFLVSTNSNSSSSDDMYFSRGSKNRKSQSTYRQKVDSNGKVATSRKGAKRKERTVSTDSNKSKSMIAPFLPARQIWRWSGKSFKRPGIKGKARKEFYKAITRGKETIMVGDCAVFLSTGRPHLPYVGRIELMWKSWGGNMLVRVKWFYHPEETKGGRRLNDMKGALYQSPHADENDVQTISHKCEVLSWQDYTKRQEQQVGHGCNKYGSNVHCDNNDIYYLAGTYDPITGEISMEPGVS